MKFGCFNIGKPSPFIVGSADKAADDYCRQLNEIGKKVLAGVLSIGIINPTPMVLIVTMLGVMAFIFYKGEGYRKHLKDSWKSLRLLTKAWFFLISLAIVHAIVIGLISIEQVFSDKSGKYCFSSWFDFQF